MSQHLRVLLDAGLVSESRIGRENRYHLEAAPLAEVRDWAGHYEEFWSEKLQALSVVLDELP